VGSGSVISIIHCGSFYGKYNKLPMDENAVRRELEHSGDDEDYLSLMFMGPCIILIVE